MKKPISEYSLFAAVVLLTPMVILGAMAMDIYVPAVPNMPHWLHTTTSGVQWTLSIYVFGLGLGELILVFFIDKFGRRPIVIGSIFLYTVSSILCALSTRVDMLIAVRLIQSLGASSCFVTSRAIVRDAFDYKTGAKIYSYINGAISLSPILAPVIGGYLLWAFHHWQVNFWFVALFGIFALTQVYFYLAETYVPSDDMKQASVFPHVATLLKHSTFMKYSYFAGVAMTGLFVYFSASPILLISHLGISEHHFGYYFGINAAMFMLASIYSPKLQEYFGIDKAILFGLVLMFLGSAIIVALHHQFGLNKWAIVLPMLCVNFGIGNMLGPATAGAMRDFPHIAGTASAVYGVFQFGIAAIAGEIVMQFDTSTPVPFAMSFVMLSGVAIWLCYLLCRVRVL